MPRYPRLFIRYIPVHIVQRGHDRNSVFLRESDYRYYLSNLKEAKTEYDVSVLAYCLMSNHVHLVLEPKAQPAAISKLMRVLAARQTRRVNRLDKRSGTLWEGRFKASLIDTDHYLLACCRYVDLNPIRALLVTRPADYPWSGFRGRVGIACDPILDDHPIFDSLGASRAQRARAYGQFVADGICESQLSVIRQSLQRNQLTGGEKFLSRIEAKAGHRLSAYGPGRPRRKAT